MTEKSKQELEEIKGQRFTARSLVSAVHFFRDWAFASFSMFHSHDIEHPDILLTVASYSVVMDLKAQFITH